MLASYFTMLVSLPDWYRSAHIYRRESGASGDLHCARRCIAMAMCLSRYQRISARVVHSSVDFRFMLAAFAVLLAVSASLLVSSDT